MKTVFEYTRENILVIPQALFGMKDVAVLASHGGSVILYKQLEKDLIDIEFYTNHPCLVYIENGFESLTNCDNDVIELHSGTGIFLPQGANLHSDFVRKTESLRAYLVFFDERVITDYLAKCKIKQGPAAALQDYCIVEDTNQEILRFFETMHYRIIDQAYLETKLQELLHLVAWNGGSAGLQSLLLAKSTVSPKRNITRLLEAHDVLNLSVSDLAHISGRSLSSFNRDFKAIYQVPPQQWLRDKRLSHAKELLSQQGLSVTDVAMEIGYQNVSHFIKAFKSKYGYTPKQTKLNA